MVKSARGEGANVRTCSEALAAEADGTATFAVGTGIADT